MVSQSVGKIKPWAGLYFHLTLLKPATKKEIQILRKLWHAGMMSLIALLYLYVLPSQKSALIWIAAVGGPMIFLDFLRLEWKKLNRFIAFLGGPFMRKRELSTLTSMTHFIIALFFLVACFPKPVVVLSIFCLALGDPAACIVGIKYGKDLLFKGKTLQGSLACFIVCFLTALFILNHYGVSSHYILIVSMVVSLVATITEVLTSKILDDNLTIPIAIALVVHPLLLITTTF